MSRRFDAQQGLQLGAYFARLIMSCRALCSAVAAVALSMLLSGPAAVAQAPSNCPPAPEPNPAGVYAGFGGATYVTRDAVSCRILLQQFGWNQNFVYEFWWAEGSMDHIRVIAESGTPVVFVDQVMTTPPVRVVEFYNRHLDHYFITIEGVGGRGHRCRTCRTGLGENRTGLHRVAARPDCRPADFRRPVPLLRVPDHRAQQPLLHRGGARV